MSAIIALVAAATTPPTFAPDFYTGAYQTATLVSGPVYPVKDGVCCAVDGDAICSARTMAMGSDTYEQGSKNRTVLVGNGRRVVTWFGDVMKQMEVVPSDGKHAWECAAFCPVKGDFEPSVVIGDRPDPPYNFTQPRAAGTGSYTQPTSAGGATKTCDRWEWMQKIAVFPVGHITAYVDTSVTPPQPFGQTKALLSIAHGWENVSFAGWTTGVPLEDQFDIDPDSIAACPKLTVADGCAETVPDEEALLSPVLKAALRFGLLRARGGDARARAARAAASPKTPPPQPNVTFVQDFTSAEEQLVVANQNGYTNDAGDVCCSYGSRTAPGQCNVQKVRTHGMRYFDVTNQRSRYDDLIGGGIEVHDYKLHKMLLVHIPNGSDTLTCVEYCPIDEREVLRFGPWAKDDAVQDMGKVRWEGREVEHYFWKERASPLPITLQSNDLYADATDPTAAIPLRKVSVPLGAQGLGVQQNLTWSGLKVGTPDPKLFVVAGVDACPKAADCQSPVHMRSRLALDQRYTLARYAA